MKRGPKPKLKPAKCSYRLNNPVVVLGIGELERLLNHCTSLIDLRLQPESVRDQIMNRHYQLLKEGRDRVRNAKMFYNLAVEAE